MIRKFFKKLGKNTSKFDDFLRKYNLPKAYFATNRKAITRGLLVGLFWGFIPMPMQMAGVLATTPFLKFNVPLGLATVWLSNPITYPPLWYLEYLTGNLILGRDGISNIELTLDWFSNHWDDIVVPLYVGTAFYSTVVSYLIYLFVNWLWKRSVHKDRGKKC
jgi:uncharacterized protein (DUF2062 family)